MLDFLNSRFIRINSIKGAKTACEDLLKVGSNRFNHTLTVVEYLDELIIMNPELLPLTDLLLQSAYLHDVGYNEDIAFSHFHPYDSYSYAKANSWNTDVCLLILHHTGAERLQKKLSPELTAEYERYQLPENLKLANDLLSLADLHSKGDGTKVSVEERLKDIRDRYGETHDIYLQAKETALGLEYLKEEIKIYKW